MESEEQTVPHPKEIYGVFMMIYYVKSQHKFYKKTYNRDRIHTNTKLSDIRLIVLLSFRINLRSILSASDSFSTILALYKFVCMYVSGRSGVDMSTPVHPVAFVHHSTARGDAPMCLSQAAR